MFFLLAQCPMLTAPDNGMISCTGNDVSIRDTCTVTCDDGFEFSGS